LHEAAKRPLQTLPHARIGVAPHSLRAVDGESLTRVVEMFGDGPIHLHVAEQVKEVADCRAATGTTPVAWLLDHLPVDERWCAIHATHMTPDETERLAKTGAVVGLCPQTEANLGDGVFDGARFLFAGGRFGIGSDSNIRVDAAEELRTLEYGQRLRDRARNVLAKGGVSTGRTLLERACRDGARAIGRDAGTLAVGRLADIVSLAPEHPSLAGRSEDGAIDAWIFCGDQSLIQHVWVAGRQLVRDGRHPRRAEIAMRFRSAMRGLLERI
ncbi:MAG TPA: amidohydrolase family protein, partial [Planctomycetia bacterium]|nr:amidohydrolase family protein [Planctomycetia bacterium]